MEELEFRKKREEEQERVNQGRRLNKLIVNGNLTEENFNEYRDSVNYCPDVNNGYFTPLMHAIACNNFDAAQLLIAHGANPIMVISVSSYLIVSFMHRQYTFVSIYCTK